MPKGSCCTAVVVSLLLLVGGQSAVTGGLNLLQMRRHAHGDACWGHALSVHATLACICCRLADPAWSHWLSGWSAAGRLLCQGRLHVAGSARWTGDNMATPRKGLTDH